MKPKPPPQAPSQSQSQSQAQSSPPAPLSPAPALGPGQALGAAARGPEPAFGLGAAVAAARTPALALPPALQPHWPYLAAAAVLTDFAPEHLRPLGGGEPGIAGVSAMLAAHGVPLRSGPAKGHWTLASTSRRAALAELARRGELPQALEANAGAARASNAVQRQLDKLLLHGKPPGLRGWPMEDLLGLERALSFVGDAVFVPPGLHAAVVARIENLRLLEPLQRLVARGFAGRAAELKALRAYVDDQPSKGFMEWVSRKVSNVLDIFRHRPPLVVWGPGGVGKSTLLARFLLDHAGPDHTDPTPYVYLDFDRGQLDPMQPDTLLLEAFRQIRLQFPAVAQQAEDLAQQATTRILSEDNVTPSRSAHFDQSTQLRKDFVDLLRHISGSSGKNFLLFVDTFEVVQRRGLTPVHSVLLLGAQLLQELPRLRLVIAGRAALRLGDFVATPSSPQPAWQPLNLQGFDAEAGRAYLAQQVGALGRPLPPPRVLDRMVALVHGNPLSLRLAAQVFAQADLPALESAVEQALFDAEFTHERVQGMLHARIVASLDEPLRQVADPGLVVRRLTPAVIEQVLAAHCGLLLQPPWTAEELFQGLQREVALVEPAGPGMLRHRPDVRLLMLPLLRAKLGPAARAIDEAAARFWRGRNDPEARAEEIYHLLWLGAPAEQLDEAWQRGPVARAGLEEALDELEALEGSPAARIWLHGRLQREIGPQLEQLAGLVDWERSTAQRTHALLARGNPADALSALRARPERSPASPLWLLELEALKLLGRDAEALQRVDQALAAEPGRAAGAHVLALLLTQAGLLERTRQLEQGLAAARRAVRLAQAMGDAAAEFEALLMQARLARKAGQPEDAALLQRLQHMAVQRPPQPEAAGNTGSSVDGEAPAGAVQQALAARPALLGEAAAEIGHLQPALLVAAHERFVGQGRRPPLPSKGGSTGPAYDPALDIGLASAQAAMGRHDEARTLLQRLLDDPAVAGQPELRQRARLQWANLLVEAGTYREAAAAYEACVMEPSTFGAAATWVRLAQQGLDTVVNSYLAAGRPATVAPGTPQPSPAQQAALPGREAELMQLRDAARTEVDRLLNQTLLA
jgi:tetratricopeptide (TPR) repeat protein